MNNENIRILLVEDDTSYCHKVAMALRQWSRASQLTVHLAGNLVEAISKIRQNRYDMILLDLGLPESCGLDTFDNVRRADPDVPVVILTCLDDEQTAIESISRGASDYIVKGATSLTEILGRSILYTLERKRAQEALRQSESNFRNLVDKNPDAILVTDKEAVVLFANPAAEVLFGRKAEELRGKPLELPAARGETGEIEVVRENGPKAVVEMRTIETNWQGDQAYLVSLRNITRHKSAQNLLKKYRENLRALIRERTAETDAEKELLSVTFSSIAEGIVVVDPDKRILLFNEVAEELAGWEFELVQDKPIDELFHVVNGRTREVVQSPVEKVLGSGTIECGSNFDVLVAPDGRERPISTIAAPVRLDDTIIGVVLVFRDVSREREVERMKEDFISSVSHELRTPLTSIIAYTETILHDSGMPGRTRRQFLGVIEEEGRRLADLIEGLLEVSRLESGAVKILREPVDVSVVVRRVMRSLQPLAQVKGVALNSDIDETLPELSGDEGKILSVVTNLVNNALKFTPHQGKVSVSVCCENQEIVIRVADTGMGIPKEALDRIFDPFYRVPTSTEWIQGTGLGLAIVARIVALHNGRITVESEVNKGTTFSVHLPLAPECVPAPALASRD
ncbi:MAG TPA: ATP-binding protein [Sedimentisphaerales bacterium]|nr:ATP-binding protein [Sedimentisphaerales bacterium]